MLGVVEQPTMGQQGIEKFGRVAGQRWQAREDVAQVGPGFDLIGLAASDQAVQDRRPASTGATGDEQPGFPPQSGDLHGAFTGVVVDAELAFLAVPSQCLPLIASVIERFSGRSRTGRSGAGFIRQRIGFPFGSERAGARDVDEPRCGQGSIAKRTNQTLIGRIYLAVCERRLKRPAPGRRSASDREKWRSWPRSAGV